MIFRGVLGRTLKKITGTHNEADETFRHVLNELDDECHHEREDSKRLSEHDGENHV